MKRQRNLATMTIATSKEPSHFLNQFAGFERRHDAAARPALRRLRNAAIARFAELGFPSDRDEDWKFTSLAELRKTPFQLAPADNGESLALVTGSGALPPGVVVGRIADALRDYPQLIERHLGNYADY